MVNKQILDICHYDQRKSKNGTFHISNSIINSLHFPAFEIHSNVVIENCIIDTLIINSTWFEAGLILRNNIIKTQIDYEAAGHNKQPIIIENNIFEEYFDFFDCQFEEQVIVRNNLFVKGTNLLSKENHYTDPSFEKGIIVENNIGRLDIP